MQWCMKLNSHMRLGFERFFNVCFHMRRSGVKKDKAWVPGLKHCPLRNRFSMSVPSFRIVPYIETLCFIVIPS